MLHGQVNELSKRRAIMLLLVEAMLQGHSMPCAALAWTGEVELSTCARVDCLATGVVSPSGVELGMCCEAALRCWSCCGVAGTSARASGRLLGERLSQKDDRSPLRELASDV